MRDRSRLYLVDAVVLRRHDLGEADRLLTLFTRESGKLRAVAKGARKPSSRKAGHIELFTHSRLLLAKGRNLDIITQAETIEPFLRMRSDLMRTSYAYYLAELVDRFSEDGDESPLVFRLFLESLRGLSNHGDPELLTRAFELGILALSGYRPELDRCLQCGDPVSHGTFSSAQGGVLCPTHGRGKGRRLSAGALDHLRHLQAGGLAASQAISPDEASRQEMEASLRDYIRYLLDREPRSAVFLAQVRRQAVDSAAASAQAGGART